MMLSFRVCCHIDAFAHGPWFHLPEFWRRPIVHASRIPARPSSAGHSNEERRPSGVAPLSS
eukprot:4650136-Pyramimonas_sp.AAC.1